MKARIVFIILLLCITITICSCGKDQIIYAYVVAKPLPEQSDISEWRPVMRVTYRVSNNKVISEVARFRLSTKKSK